MDPQILEDLQEIGNIGAGYAASRLSDKIHQRCRVNIPETAFLPVADIKTRFDMDRVLAVSIMIRVHGDIPAIMMVLMKKRDAQKLLKMMLPFPERRSSKDFSFVAQYALKNLAELLTVSFVKAVGEFLHIRYKLSMPEVVVDSWSTSLDLLINQLDKPDEDKLVIHSRFHGTESPFEGTFLYIMNHESLNRMVKALGLGE